MTIEEVEQWAKQNKFTIVADEWWDAAQDIISKYQKIEQIIEVWHQDIFAKDFECIAEVAEVVEDGNDKRRNYSR